MVCTDLKDQMSVIPNRGLEVYKGEEAGTEQACEEIGLGNKWSSRRYEHPRSSDSVGETGIGATKVALNYDLVDPALEPGVATKLLCNSTDPTLSSS